MLSRIFDLSCNGEIVFRDCDVVLKHHKHELRETWSGPLRFVGCGIVLSDKHSLGNHEYTFSECTVSCELFDASLESNGRNIFFHSCTFEPMKLALRGVEMDDCRFRRVIFDWAVDTSFQKTKFSQCSFVGKFERNIFHGATANSTTFTAATEFIGCRMDGFTVSRFDLHGLKDNGGLTMRQLATMNIRNDVAELRASFSGFMQWFHIIALIAFLSPYMSFVAGRIMSGFMLDQATTFVTGIEPYIHNNLLPVTAAEEVFRNRLLTYRDALESVETASLFRQLGYYIVSGGETNSEYRPAYWSMTLLFVVLVYNVFRGYLLLFTKKLEQQEIVTELPSSFAFEEHPVKYGIYSVRKPLFLINIGATIWHLILFSMREFPV